jgi:hypothetical protein
MTLGWLGNVLAILFLVVFIGLVMLWFVTAPRT